MNRILSVVCIGSVLACAGACERTVVPAEPQFTNAEVAGRDLPSAPDNRVYKYRATTVNADSLLRAMVRAQVPVVEAWLPLEDLCADAVGPRFTVVLRAPDVVMQRFGFEPGSGIRACTTRVKRYVLAP